jgi:CrcB protein
VNILFIAAGGSLGAVSRYLVSGWVQAWSGGSWPLGTLVVNVLGCFIIGLLSQLAESTGVFTPATRALFFTGFLGGFTTYSTFSAEAYNLAADGAALSTTLYIGLHIVLGLAAVWLGRTTAWLIWK